MSPSKRIMLIDDDPDDQLFFRDALQTIDPGLQCDLNSSCQQAFKQLELPPPPDLIFMDLNMPVMNGFDCLAYLKKQVRYRDIPVIIFTTSKNSKDIDKTRQLGAKWYMTKPDDFNLLCKKLGSILKMDMKAESYTV